MSLFGGSGLPTSFLPPESPYSFYHQEYLEELAQQETNDNTDTNTITENPTPTTITTDDYLLQEENEEIIKDYLNIPEGSVLVNDLLTIQNGYITIDASLLPTGDLVLALPTGEDIQIINEDTTTTIITYDENNTTITIEYNGYTYSIATHYITEEQITEVQTHTITNDDGDDAEVITTASLRTLGHSNFDYHNYQLDNNYLDIRLKYEFYYVDANGVPTDDTNATKVYYTGMYQLTPGSYDQHQHTIIDKNDTNIRTIKIPDASTLTALRVHIVDGEGTIYINNTAVHLNIQNTSVSLTSLNHNDILKIEYVSDFVSDTVEFKILLQNFTEYIPRDLIQTNYNGNVITRSTQPIWYVRNNVIIINLEMLVGHRYMFNNPDSYTGYVPVFPHNYRPNNNGYFPEIAIPYQSGMKVKWLGLTSVMTPNGGNWSQLKIIRAQYNEETAGWGGIIYPAGWGHSSSNMTADYEYDIVDGDPNGGNEYVGTYLEMEMNNDSLYKTAINVYFHKIPTPPTINSATEQFYKIESSSITLTPYSIVNNQLRFIYGTGSLEHYADIGGSYYLYVPDSITAINTTTSYPSSDSVLVKIGDDSMYGYKFRGTPWNIGDEINVYEYATGNTVFTLVLTDDYSLGYAGAGLPVPAVYPEPNNIGVPDFNNVTGRTEIRIYNDDATTMTFFGIPSNPILDRNSNYYLYIPDNQNEIKMVYPYWMRNTTKNFWMNTGAYNLNAGGINNRGQNQKWENGDVLAISNTSALTDPVYLTITNVSG